jgi:hypothetical protein
MRIGKETEMSRPVDLARAAILGRNAYTNAMLAIGDEGS